MKYLITLFLKVFADFCLEVRIKILYLVTYQDYMTPHDFSSLLKSLSTTQRFVLDPAISITKYTPICLAQSNKAFKTIDVSSSAALDSYINNQVKKNHALVAFGGYNETRNIYQRSNYFNPENHETERNIHIGMDLWLAADSSVFTPLDGTVHSFKNNTNHGDYGPTIILKHMIEEVEFYTLYGHLSLMSIENLEVGQRFNQNQQIATLGATSINGDYPPHLHFQIIRDMQCFKGDYPGVCNKSDRAFYLKNCPDPNELLRLM